jgi:hypothetical protein
VGPELEEHRKNFLTWFFEPDFCSQCSLSLLPVSDLASGHDLIGKLSAMAVASY